VQLALPTAGLDRYKNPSQVARVASESWGLRNLYCPNCTSPRLNSTPANTPVIDYTCPLCASLFQLKAQGHSLGARILDAGYDKMVHAIRENRRPNLFAVYYLPNEWSVWNLLLIPSFGLPLSAIEKRKPLSSSAERRGWVGCNIRIDLIPSDAKILVISEGKTVPARVVRERYDRVRPLQTLDVERRGWTLDVLNVVRSLGKRDFSLPDVYGLEKQLGQLHPSNRHVRDKIRQQLQILRDLGFLEFLGGGDYRLI